MVFQKGNNSGENNPMFGRPVSEETREKIRLALIGKHRTEETKQKLRLALLGNKNGRGGKGKVCSDEAKKNMSLAHKGIKFSDEAKARMSLAQGRGSENSSWKGGRLLNRNGGYIMIYKTEHPRATKQGYVFEHRLVMEKKLGRYLLPYEVVHHINGVKDDNRPENLELLSNNNIHNKQIQKVYQENLKLKEKIKKYELSYGII